MYEQRDASRDSLIFEFSNLLIRTQTENFSSNHSGSYVITHTYI